MPRREQLCSQSVLCLRRECEVGARRHRVSPGCWGVVRKLMRMKCFPGLTWTRAGLTVSCTIDDQASSPLRGATWPSPSSTPFARHCVSSSAGNVPCAALRSPTSSQSRPWPRSVRCCRCVLQPEDFAPSRCADARNASTSLSTIRSSAACSSWLSTDNNSASSTCPSSSLAARVRLPAGVGHSWK